ncbi:MAG: alpha/beta fold hydrolase [Flavobacteriales bacterium]|nr:alpha/beta fold hydrolase [Flavobacteriales bacterium]
MKLHSCLFLVLLIILPNFGEAQTLKRSAFLGIQMQPVPDSLRLSELGYRNGVLAVRVFPNSTASELGMESGDILLSIDEMQAVEPRFVAETISAYGAGDEVELKWLRAGERMQQSGKMLGRPLETSEYGSVSYGQVDYDGTSLRSIMMLPEGKTKPPVVFFMQGYTCATTEFPFNQNITLRRIMDDFVKAGYAVFRVDKPGVGDSKSDTPCQTTGFDVELKAFGEGYKALALRDDIDASNIFLFGHSMGGIVAPILAAEMQPKGVMTYGTAIKSWYEYMIEMTRVQAELFGNSFERVEEVSRLAIPFHYDFLINKLSSETLIERHAEFLAYEETADAIKEDQYIGRHMVFWQTLNEQNITEAWLKYEGNVLAIYGEFDIQALNADHVKAIARTVNSAHPNHAEYAIIPNADHGFVRFETMDEQMEALNTGQYGKYLREAYHEGVAAEAITWMNDLK